MLLTGLASPVGLIATSFELVDNLRAVRKAGPDQNAGQLVTAARGYEGVVCQHVELARVVCGLGLERPQVPQKRIPIFMARRDDIRAVPRQSISS